MSSRCPHNMVNFGPLAAEIGLPVWGTPANFNGFRILAPLLHGSQVVGVSQTLQHWTEGATYVRQGGHHVGHWPTFLVQFCSNNATDLYHLTSHGTHIENIMWPQITVMPLHPRYTLVILSNVTTVVVESPSSNCTQFSLCVYIYVCVCIVHI